MWIYCRDALLGATAGNLGLFILAIPFFNHAGGVSNFLACINELGIHFLLCVGPVVGMMTGRRIRQSTTPFSKGQLKIFGAKLAAPFIVGLVLLLFFRFLLILPTPHPLSYWPAFVIFNGMAVLLVFLGCLWMCGLIQMAEAKNLENLKADQLTVQNLG